MILQWFKRKPTEVTDVVLLPPSVPPEGMMGNPVHIPLNSMKALAASYVSAMETQRTDDWCRCEWAIHPDDAGIKDNHCRDCGGPREGFATHTDNDHPYFHKFAGKRKRRLDEAPDCPVHTKEGFLLYFFQWVLDHAGD